MGQMASVGVGVGHMASGGKCGPHGQCGLGVGHLASEGEDAGQIASGGRCGPDGQ